MTKLFIGFDPGFTGGISAIPSTGDALATVHRMPTIQAGPQNRSEYNVHEIVSIIRAEVERAGNPPAHEVCAVIEKQWAMNKMSGGDVCKACKRPKNVQGVSSMFSQGQGFGIIKGVVTALGFLVILPPPMTWKTRMALVGKGKEAARAMALNLFPHLSAELKYKKDAGPAEALLIAQYAKIQESSW